MKRPSHIEIRSWDTGEVLCSVERGLNSEYSLKGLDFSGKNLKRASLWGSLEGANFTEADLTEADFRFASVDGADFTGAKLEGVRYGACLMISQAPGVVSPAIAEIVRLIKESGLTREQVVQIIKMPTLKCLSESAARLALQRLRNHLTSHLFELAKETEEADARAARFDKRLDDESFCEIAGEYELRDMGKSTLYAVLESRSNFNQEYRRLQSIGAL